MSRTKLADTDWPSMWRSEAPPPRNWIDLIAALLRDTPRLGSDAACMRSDPAIFDSTSRRDVETAAEICEDCPVIELCASWARRNAEDLRGVCGGLVMAEGFAFTVGEWLGDDDD